ncbi:MAG: LuxR C-terminal-related transcriptional regulator [Nakamurella sp.]
MSERLPSLLMLKAVPPAVPPGLVRRPRLEERLTRGALKSFTLVSAGPGAGKTLALASWVASDAPPAPVSWLSLDSTDNEPRTFWTDLLAAVTASGAVPIDSALRDIIPAAGFGTDEALEVRARLAELPSPIVLVLDDFHEITDDVVLTSFGQLVDHQPPQLRLVVLSRSDPDLRLHRLRVSGQLTEIRTRDLAFSEQETAELFDLEGIQLRAEQVNLLRARTEGWSAGLRLAALSLDPADVDGGIERFSGNDRSTAEYLVGEVLGRLSPDDREFLLTTSITSKLNGQLADYLTGRADSQVVLEKLVGANAFVVALGDQGEWFSYHPLLRDLLQYRLGLENAAGAAEVHRRAASWMAMHGEPIESIRHWIAADDFAGAGRMLLAVLPKVLGPEGPAFVAVIEPLARSANEHPELSSLLASAACHLYRHEYAAMQRDAVEAKEFLPGEADEVRVPAEAVISLFEMAAARFSADGETVVRKANQVVDLLDQTPRRLVPAGRHYRAIAVTNLGGGQLWAGELDDAERNLALVEPDALELGLLFVHLNAIGHHAVLDALQGRLRQATRRARDAVAIIDKRGWAAEPQALASFLAYGLVGLARGEATNAAAHITRGLSLSGQQTDRTLRLALAVAAVELAVLRGERDAALIADTRLRAGLARSPKTPDLLVRWAAVAGAEAMLLADRAGEAVDRIGRPSGGDHLAAALERVTLAKCRLALGQQHAAELLIEPLLVAGYRYREPAIAAQLIRGLIAERNHRDSASLAAVTSAIDLAQPEGIRRPFLAAGAQLAAPLLRYQNLGGRHSAFAAELADALAPARPASDAADLLVEHLTERELIVLRYLPTMLKAGEIASDLFVSVNTVKAHLRSMYRKLGVSNRREAVEKARAIGLL